MGEKKRRADASRREAWLKNAGREMAESLDHQMTQGLFHPPRQQGKSSGAEMMQAMRLIADAKRPEDIHIYTDKGGLAALERKVAEMDIRLPAALGGPMRFAGVPIEIHPVGTFMYHPGLQKIFQIEENKFVTAPPGFKPFSREEVMGKVVEL